MVEANKSVANSDLKAAGGKGGKSVWGALVAVFGGLFLIIFVIVLLTVIDVTGVFVPLFDMLGLDVATTLRRGLLLFLDVVLGGLALVSFVIFLIKVIKLTKTPKENQPVKKKFLKQSILWAFSLFLAFVGLLLTAIFINVKPIEATSGILTEPEKTLSLTAPVQVSFDARFIGLDRKYEAVLYEWDFGDKTERQTGERITHTFKKKGPGLYPVTLSITLRDRGTGELFKVQRIHNVTITNEKVQASFRSDPERGKPPLSVSFDAVASSDPDGEILSYEWDFDNDGGFDDATGVTAKYIFEKLGEYPVSLRVTDNNREFAVETFLIDVNEGDDPKAVVKILNLASTDESPELDKGKTYTFDASDSDSPLGRITNYEWNFGDDTKPVKTRIANHVFEKDGAYDVVLKITDEESRIGETTLTVRVTAKASAPKAVIKTLPESASGKAPLKVGFDASASTDPDDDIVDYSWDFDGDGTYDTISETVNHTYPDSGEYFAVLRVTDSADNETTARVKITVGKAGVLAKLSASPTGGEAPLTVNFDASSSTYTGGTIVSYKWNFGDGSPVRLDDASVTYRYTTIGEFDASVTAVASDGTEGTTTTRVTVRPVSVTACFEPSATSGPAPLTVTFDPKCSRGSIVKYVWDFAGQETDRSRKPTYTFDLPGQYIVTLEVSDNQNIIDTFNTTLTVTE